MRALTSTTLGSTSATAKSAVGSCGGELWHSLDSAPLAARPSYAVQARGGCAQLAGCAALYISIMELDG